MEFLRRLRSEYRVRKAVRKMEPESLEDEVLTVFCKAFSEDKERNLILQQHQATASKRKSIREEIYRSHPDWKNNAPKPEAIVMAKVN